MGEFGLLRSLESTYLQSRKSDREVFYYSPLKEPLLPEPLSPRHVSFSG